MKRTKLADITNTVQFKGKLKDAPCGVTKDYISQVIEENAALLKALGERTKFIELSSAELQKFSVAVEKGNQQNRHLALANSQMLAELNLCKERVKALQHELGCTMAVLRLKNSELTEKEKLNKELQEKLTRKVCKCFEDAQDASKVSSVSNNIVPELDKNLELDKKEKLSKELCEDVSTKMGISSKCAEVTTDASIPPSHSTSTNSPTRRRTMRSRSSTSLINQVQEKEKNELHEKLSEEKKEKRSKELCEDVSTKMGISSKCAEVTTDASIPPSHSTSTNSPTRRRTMRSRSSTSLINQAKEKEKNELHEKLSEEEAASRNVEKVTDVPQVPSGKEKLDRNLHETSEEQPKIMKVVATAASEADSVDINMASKQNRKRSLRNQTSCSANLTHPVEEVKQKDAKIRRKSSRRISCNVEQEPRESKDHLFEILDVADVADIPDCSLQPLIDENPIHEADCTNKVQTLELQRSSVGGRPARRAAEKVTSYKEIPLKLKMRRPE